MKSKNVSLKFKRKYKCKFCSYKGRDWEIKPFSQDKRHNRLRLLKCPECNRHMIILRK